MNPRPRLRSDLVLVEQTYRGEQTWIVKDPVSHKYFRLRPIEIVIMQALDGDHSLAEVATALAAEGVPVSERALGGFVRSLSGMGLLERTVGERSVLALERVRAERRQRRRPRLFRGDLLRMRWSVGDPDRLFDRWMPRLGFFFTPAFFAASAALFLIYGLAIAARWSEFHAELVALYTPSSYTLGKLAVIIFTSLVIIGIHELGHGVACKHFGGHVHELGAMLIWFQPAFYCNVNDAWTFPERSARLWVTAAGSWIQLVLAGIAALVWFVVRPDTVIGEVAIVAVIVGGATTVLANANPLMPLDGYYALSDWLEIPNLRQRAFARLGWVVKRRLLGLDLPEPPADDRERRVLLVYAVLSIAYAGLVFILLGAAAWGWVRRLFGALGALAFLAAIFLMLRGRILEGARVVRRAARARLALWRDSSRGRRIGAGVAIAILVVLLLPWPLTVSGPFVTMPALESELTAPDSGVVAEVMAREGMAVTPGAPLLRVSNLALERAATAASWERDSLDRRARAARAAGDAGEAAELETREAGVAARADELTARNQAMTLRAVSAGVVVTPRPELLAGRRATAGAVLLTVADEAELEARVTLSGAGATAVRVGQGARMILHDGTAGTGVVTSVTPAAASGAGIARIRLAAVTWRPGTTGRARITLRNATIAGVLWWRVRSLLRGDILL